MEIDKESELKLKFAQLEQEKTRLKQELDIANTKEINEMRRHNSIVADKGLERMFNSIITYGQAALKSAVLINGAAAIGVFTFLGNALSKGGALFHPKNVVNGVSFFGEGVLFGALAIGVTYLVQVFYTEIYDREIKHLIKSASEGAPSEIKEEKLRYIAYFFHITSIVLVAISYFCFYRGAIMVVEAFSCIK